MTTDEHLSLRATNLATVTETLGGVNWTCFDSQIRGVDNTSSSWYIVVEDKKFWAFVTNGKVTSTTLMRA